MNAPALSSEQQRAIDAADGKLTVRASAGAGKTRVLVARYLRHVMEDGLRPDQILTITFTRKAAAGMKQRIVDELRKQGRSYEAQIAETGPIQTIHSFCERVLRENALSAGVDPEFEILSDSQGKDLIHDVLRMELCQGIEDRPLVHSLIHRLAGKSVFNAPNVVEAKPAAAVMKVLDEFRSAGLDPAQLRLTYECPERLFAAYENRILQSYPDLVRDQMSASPGEGDFGSRIKEALKAAKPKMPEWATRAVSKGVDQESAEHTCGLVQLTLSVWSRLLAEMDRLQKFDFTELESRAVKLVTTDNEVRARLKRQYRVVLIDEAQDVNPVQHKLIESLQLDSQMLVGDPQQSIYGFRQADLRLFKEKTEQMPCHRLSANYRSAPGILRFVDDLFAKLWSNEYAPMAPRDVSDPFGGRVEGGYEGVELWSMPQNEHLSQTAKLISELVAEGERPGDIVVLVRRINSAQEIGKGLACHGLSYRIAGGSENLYTRMEVRDIANALQALADPADNFAMLAMMRSPMVDLSLDSIVLLAKEASSRQAIIPDLLKQFDPPIAEDGERLREFLRWFEPLSAYADRLSAWEVIAEILRQSPYLVRLAARPNSRQTLANVRKLLGMAAEEKLSGPLEYARHIRHVQEFKYREGDAPAVDNDENVLTMMTIHKSKGLEYPVVVFPDTHGPITRDCKDIVSDASSGMVATRFGLKSSAYNFLCELKTEAEREEQLRVLYVALTRACRRLCVCVDLRAKDSSIAGLIAREIGFKGEPLQGARVRKGERPPEGRNGGTVN